ncbi:Hsp70 family protein [Luedemannella helvata]|uniref:Hsp70 protein n=1 Tax=Luedemannella helvata TaxID=349315 RepID=A0ABP4WWE1_9ACTN
MVYALGIDLGTTFTAAAVWRDGRAEIASLGSRGAAIPSVVLLREDETFLIGETANRRGLSEPHRVAREFKRRLGDTTPILLGGVPVSAEALMARVLRSVIDEVTRREGGAPASITVSHPANWGPYKTDLLRQAVRIAGLEQPVSYTTEPEAAAVFYARQQRIEPGAVVAVYDLGGGTFDAAVLRKTPTGFEILGQPEGIERLGGIDFDAAVFGHVRRAIGDAIDQLDEDDPAAIAGVARLRDEVTEAKEALSSDTDVSIPVLLPNLATEVRLTRAELEAMVRPALYDSIEALRRALRSAGVTPEQLHSVLLVGGSSRMPIVAQLVGAELGRPVAVDAHPKHAVALGAAGLAAMALGGAAGAAAVGGGAASPAADAPAGAPTLAIPVPPPGGTPVGAQPTPTVLHVAGPPTVADGGQTPPGHGGQPPVSAGPPTVPAGYPGAPGGYPGAAGGPPTMAAGFPGPAGPGAGGPGGGQAGRSRLPILAAAAAVLVLLLGGGTAYVLANMKDTPGGGDGTSSTLATTAPAIVTSAAAPPTSQAVPPTTAGPPSETPTATRPADEQCTDEIKANPRWVCITDVTFNGRQLVIRYDADWGGSTPNKRGGYHVHFYNSDGTEPAADVMGTQADDRGSWYIEDQNPSRISTSDSEFKSLNNLKLPKICARIAQANHNLVADDHTEHFRTGNCWPVRRI